MEHDLAIVEPSRAHDCQFPFCRAAERTPEVFGSELPDPKLLSNGADAYAQQFPARGFCQWLEQRFLNKRLYKRPTSQRAAQPSSHATHTAPLICLLEALFGSWGSNPGEESIQVWN